MKKFFLDLDRQRQLVYDFSSFDLIADYYTQKTGEPFDFSKFNLFLNFKDLAFLTYAGLVWEDENLTLEKTKELLNEVIRRQEKTVLDIMNVVYNAILFFCGFSEINFKALEAEKKMTA